MKENRRRGKDGLKITDNSIMEGTLKMARKPVKLQKDNPAKCAGEGKQCKGKK